MFYTVFTVYTVFEIQFILYLQHVSVWTSHTSARWPHMANCCCLDSAGLESVTSAALGGH